MHFERQRQRSRRVEVGNGMTFATRVSSFGSSNYPNPDQSGTRPFAPSGQSVAARRLSSGSTEQLTFSSADDAIQTMLHTLANEDHASLLRILGPDADEMLSSESGAGRRGSREQIVPKWGRMFHLANDSNGSTMFYLGTGIWPIPIPLVRRGPVWYFDTDAGKQEFVHRRIGENELTAIEVCHELVNAQKVCYFRGLDCKDGTEYLEKLLSDRTKYKGGYWKAESVEDKSLLGLSLALASSEGNIEDASRNLQPFHGYCFRALQGLGSTIHAASRGEPVDRNVRRCVGFLAYPAAYGSSGVMTFLVGWDGFVYEKDLGPMTAEILKAVTQVTRDKTWWKAEAGASL